MRKIQAILILGLVLRLVNLGQSFWLDEASQAVLSAKSVYSIWFERSVDVHPPLFHLLAHVWLWFGRSEIWLRLLPVSFGVANIYVIYLLVKKLISEKTAVIATLLLSINSFHIYYSQEFRAYSLLALLGTLSMYFFVEKKYMKMAVVNALILYTHYSGILLIFTQFFLSPITISYFLITILLYTPWLPQFLQQLQSSANIDQYLPGWRQMVTLSGWKALPLVYFKFIAGRINLIGKFIYPAYIFCVLIVTLLSAMLAATKRKILYSWIIIPVLLSFVISFVIPQTQPHRLIFVLPALIVVVSQACARFPRLFLTIFVYIAIFGNILYFTRPRLQREAWRSAIQYVNLHPAPAVIAFSNKFAPMDWYQTNFDIIPAVFGFPGKPEQISQTLADSNLPNRVYYFEYLSGLTDPKRFIKIGLENLGYVLIATHNFEGVGFVFEYQKS